MRLIIKLSLILIFISTSTRMLFSQLTGQINPDLLKSRWPASWITHPQIQGDEYGVYLFKKTFKLDTEKESFIVHVSGDNRYKLFVNGKYVCNGPARGDIMNWRFESLDIAKYLKKGQNVIAAIVWNFTSLRPVAQFSYKTGFILQGNTSNESMVNTNKSWYVMKDTAYSPIPVNLKDYYVVGPGEEFHGNYHPWNWMNPDYDVTNWPHAKETSKGIPLLSIKEYGNPPGYILTPRKIPLMEETPQRFARIRRSDLDEIPRDFLTGKRSLAVPANAKVKVLFDQDNLTNAYPVLTISKGKNSVIKLTYAESLFTNKNEKGNRNDIEGKKIIGNYDMVISDGGAEQTFQTLWWRTFRYLEMEIETKDEPLLITDFYSIFTGYPFREKASFKCDDPLFTDIWNVGWRTQRLCAGETFFDCPYYEQLQYAGDTRIQCLTSLYVSGDTTMMRNAVSSLNDSRFSFGLTQSRYPSYQTQIIPTFSLIWITMIYDYWMHCQDEKTVKSMLPGVIEVLQWYEAKIDSTGMLGHMEWWNFVDWVIDKNWRNGKPPGLHNSHSSIINLQYVYTLQKASILLNAFNMKEQALYYSNLDEKIKSAVYHYCYDKERELIADSPEKTSFSQHATIMGVLTNTISEDFQKKALNKITNEKGIAPCSYYYRFYLTKAMEKAGLSDEYPNMLDPWIQMLKQGLTTFAEEPEPSRSDCHAWSASPVYYFLSLVCGIKPGEPGFKSVRIEPSLGRLKWIEGSVPHCLGEIKINLKKDDQGNLSGKIILPKTLPGTFKWHDHTMKLEGGENNIQLKSGSNK